MTRDIDAPDTAKRSAPPRRPWQEGV